MREGKQMVCELMNDYWLNFEATALFREGTVTLAEHQIRQRKMLISSLCIMFYFNGAFEYDSDICFPFHGDKGKANTQRT